MDGMIRRRLLVSLGGARAAAVSVRPRPSSCTCALLVP